MPSGNTGDRKDTRHSATARAVGAVRPQCCIVGSRMAELAVSLTRLNAAVADIPGHEPTTSTHRGVTP